MPDFGWDAFGATACLSVAWLSCLLGMAWLALAMDAHWAQVRPGQPLPASLARRLRWGGALAMGTSLALCLHVDHPSMAILVWVMMLTACALLTALTLAGRPRWLRVLLRVSRS